MIGRVTTLGGVRVFKDEERLADLPGQPKRCALLICVATDREDSLESLMGRLWPDRNPSRARHALHQTVYELRRMLGDGWIEATGDGLRIGEDIAVDTTQFEALLAEGRAADALEHYAGDFLQGNYLVNTKEFELWVDARRSKLRRLHRKARREALLAARESGDSGRALMLARAWAELEPFEDEAQLRFIELLAANGQRTEALEHFESYQRRLAAEEGHLEPLEELIQLVRRIRSGDGPASPPRPVAAAARLGRVVAGEPASAGRVAEAPGATPSSIAVLPFVNLSPEPASDYFSDGITEELIGVLSELSGIHVAARTSSFAFKHSNLDVRELGQRLNVQWVLEGSVRKAGNHVRIGARLISTANGYPFWSGRYDRDLEDIFAIQEEISRAIAESLSVHFAESGEMLVRRRTDRPEAYRAYLIGRYHWNRRTPDAMEEAVRSFEEAIRIDPVYSLAYLGLADACVAQAQFAYRRPADVLPRAEAACEQAFALDASIPELRTTRAHLLEVYHLDFAGSDREYQRAIAVSPRDGNTRAWYGALLVALGRFEEAKHQMHIGIQLEPFSLPMRFHNGMLLYRAREFRLALAELNATAEMSPDYYAARCFKALTLTEMGEPAQAVEVSREAIERLGPVPALLMSLGHALGALGQVEQAKQALARMDEIAKRFYVPAVLRTVVHGAIGDVDAAFRHLEEACDERYGQVMYLRVDPVFDPLRGDPRFPGIARRLNLA